MVMNSPVQVPAGILFFHFTSIGTRKLPSQAPRLFSVEGLVAAVGPRVAGRTVICGEHDNRVVVHPELFDQIEEFTDAVVQFHHPIGVDAVAALVLVFVVEDGAVAPIQNLRDQRQATEEDQSTEPDRRVDATKDLHAPQPRAVRQTPVNLSH